MATFYFCLSSSRLVLRHSRLRWASSLVSYFQTLIIPIILVTVLNAFTTPNAAPSTWTHKILLTPWDWTLSKTTPLFTLIEGFASLLVIQAIGHICRWVVNNRSDTWMVNTFIVPSRNWWQIVFLVSSASVMAGAVYFLFRIWNFPSISLADALLIGIALTAALNYILMSLPQDVELSLRAHSLLINSHLLASNEFRSGQPSVWCYARLNRSGSKYRVSSRSKDIGGIGTVIWNLRSVRFTELWVSQYLRPTWPENCVSYPIGHNVMWIWLMKSW